MPKPVAFDRDKIMEKVTDLFWRKGYHATSMQDLVDETGLNRSSIYNSFGDKHQLFFNALKFYKQKEQTEAFKHFLDASSPLKAIEGFFDATVDFILEDQANRCCLFIKSSAEISSEEQDIYKFLVDNEGDIRGLFHQLLSKAREKGEVDKSIDLLEVAAYLSSSFHGLKVTGLVSKNRSQLSAIVRQTLSVLK